VAPGVANGYTARVIRLELDHPTLKLAVVTATNVRCQASPAPLLERMQAAAARVRQDPAAFPEAVRSAVRDMLRVGGYRPSGRGKPASEFLLGAARAQGLPVVNNLVDINNLVSLATALPVSMFDADKLGASAHLRFGRAGERYVFNASGQTMDIAGIPVVCRAGREAGGEPVPADEPVGNPVKDSMLAKVGPDTRNVVAVVYGSRALPPDHLERAARDLQSLLQAFAFAGACAWYRVPESEPNPTQAVR
jgi:DNA/RNA-binding domain of Phe-tRNA-synthetase-like protein